MLKGGADKVREDTDVVAQQLSGLQDRINTIVARFTDEESGNSDANVSLEVAPKETEQPKSLGETITDLFTPATKEEKVDDAADVSADASADAVSADDDDAGDDDGIVSSALKLFRDNTEQQIKTKLTQAISDIKQLEENTKGVKQSIVDAQKSVDQYIAQLARNEAKKKAEDAKKAAEEAKAAKQRADTITARNLAKSKKSKKSEKDSSEIKFDMKLDDDLSIARDIDVNDVSDVNDRVTSSDRPVVLSVIPTGIGGKRRRARANKRKNTKRNKKQRGGRGKGCGCGLKKPKTMKRMRYRRNNRK